MSIEARPAVTPQLVIGILIMLFGIVLTLDTLHILDADHTLRLWPAALIVLGTWLLTQKNDPRARFWGSFWLFVGIWLLLNTLGLVAVGFWELVWPVAIIWFGLHLIKQTLRRGRSSTDASDTSRLTDWIHTRFTSGTGAGGTVTLFAVMGESRRSVNEPFRGGEMTAVMGGCVLDLRQATMAPGEEAAINVFALMAGHEIWVPSGWTVVSQVLPIMGGVDDKRLPTPEPAALPTGDARPRLLLRGVVMMGGLVIKS